MKLVPKKSLSQNFLQDENIIRKIISQSKILNDDLILEIGSGFGALTKHICGISKNFIIVEVDKNAIEFLKENFENENVKVFGTSFLEIDLQKISEENFKPIKIIGNIPYKITSEIIFKIFDNANFGNVVSEAILMVQKDVAIRFVAKPNSKEYGILSVFSQYYSNPKILFDVSPNCFFPKPKVWSSVVKFEMEKNIHNKIEDKIFRQTVRTCFGKRRKTVKNSLKYFPNVSENELNFFFENCDSNVKPMLNKRAENLSLDDFISLTKNITHSLLQIEYGRI